MSYDFYDDDGFDDPNLSLPPYFITCFDYFRVDAYREAIRRYAEIDPEHNLEIDMSGSWNSMKSPALLWHKEERTIGLDKFWEILRQVEGKE